MVTWFARGLLDVQTQIDDHGWLKDGYPGEGWDRRGFSGDDTRSLGKVTLLSF